MFVTCLHPKHIKNPYTGQWLETPCGKCELCLKNKSFNWTLRLQYEAASHPYCYFFTLTYSDDYVPRFHPFECEDYIDEDYLKAVEDSQSFLRTCQFRPTTYCTVDVQNFMKRLRSYVYEFLKDKDSLRTGVRYFIASEYSETTFRIHYHGLLFFDSPLLVKSDGQVLLPIERFINWSWCDYDKVTQSRTPLGRVDVQSVTSNAASYVAGYVSCRYGLPPILDTAPYRPRFWCSRFPVIGSEYMSPVREQKFLFGQATKMHLEFVSKDEIKQFDIPLWRSLEKKIFPKPPKYYDMSPSELVHMFSLARFPYVGCTYDEHVHFIVSHSSGDNSYPIFLKMCLKFYHDDVVSRHFNLSDDSQDLMDFSSCLDFNLFDWVKNCSSYRDAFYCSSRVLLKCSQYNLNLYDYYALWDSYFSRKDRDLLHSQLKFEDDVLRENKASLKQLLTMIDPLFVEDRRNLNDSVRDGYFSQFGFDSPELVGNLWSDSTYFKVEADRKIEFYKVGKRNKLKNWYLEQHPELRCTFNTIT